jgi:hypothetical protein
MKNSIIRTLTLNQSGIRQLFILSVSLAMFLFAACNSNSPSEPQNLDGSITNNGGLSYPGPLAGVASSNIQISGTTAADVAAVATGGGFINVVNNGAHVAATQSGTGTINILNNGQVLTATNTGTGVMTINSTAIGAVTVTNTGNGRVNVTATGSAAIALTHTGDDDFTYPSPLAGAITAATAEAEASPITVSGSNAAGVAPVVTGGGFINVVNNGAFVAATQTGTGTIDILNNGQVMTATNTGTGVMTINSTCTGAVTVTNTGNGRVTVTAAGLAPITLTHTGDDDFTYPKP